MLQIPIQPIPSQIVKCVLGNQNVQIALYSKDQGIFCDVNSNGVDIVTGILCLDAVPIICVGYAGFIGQLMFCDTQGSSDPAYAGLGSRYQLIYLTAADYAAAGLA